LGSELVVNGDFSSATGWSTINVTIASGVATITGNPSLFRSMTTVAGVTYCVSITVAGLTGGSLWLRFTGGTAISSGTFGNGTHQFLLRSNGNTTLLIEQVSGTITAGTIDNVSVRELPGHHATQATSGARPALHQEAGGQYYLAFDGTDDILSTGNIDFTATDKMSLFAGVRRITDTGNVIAELSNNINNNAGSFLLFSGTSGNGFGPGFCTMSRGAAIAAGTQFAITPATFTPPVTAVLSATHDIAGDLSTIRGNGVAGTNGTSDKGAGNFGNYPLFVGGRGTGGLFLQGRIYSLIVLGRTATAAEIAQTEAWVNSKTGAY
jgi:hypothetical protein